MQAASNSPGAHREWSRLIRYRTLKVRQKRIFLIKINHNNSEHGEFLDFFEVAGVMGSMYEHSDAIHV